MVHELTLIIQDKKHIIVGDSTKILVKDAIEILKQHKTRQAEQAIKFLKMGRLFFRVVPDASITCSITKI